MKNPFRSLLEEKIIVLDGAMGTMLQQLNLGPKDFGGAEFEMLSDILSLTRPDALESVHLQYLQAGADCIETNTFGASPLRLKEYDFSRLEDWVFSEPHAPFDIRSAGYEQIAHEMNIGACRAARSAIDTYKASLEYDGRPLFVAGSVGPSNTVLSPTQADLKQGSWDEIARNFYVQVKALIQGGADIILFETQQDILEVKAAIAGAKQAMKETGKDLPIMVQVTVNEFSRMQIFNTDILAALTTVKDLGIDVFGINCSLGPDLMEPTVKKLAQASSLPISALPNAGLPESENGRTVYRLCPEVLAEHLFEFVTRHGVNIVGGCCGTTPDHIREVKKRVSGITPSPRPEQKGLFLSGPQNAVELDSSDALIRIGERLNVRGSKKVRDAVETDGPMNFSVLDEVVKEQIEDLGTAVIDVCMDSAVVDTRTVLAEVVRSVSMDFKGVLCLDSFDPDALKAAVQVYPGRALINSISMESHAPGLSKADHILENTAFHSPAYIGLAADDQGPAQTRQEKIRIANALVAACEKHQIPASQLLVDINAFPIGSESIDGMNFALESLESIPGIKQLAPGIKTTIGVSNLTNGLAKKPYMRMVLTSVFLDEGRKRGLDAAIVNPNHYLPVSAIDPKDYALALKVILERDMDAYARLEEVAQRKQGKPMVKKKDYATLEPAQAVCEKIKDGLKHQEPGSLVFNTTAYAYTDTIVKDAAVALEALDPIVFINDYLMKAMADLGDQFAAGEVSLPHLLKSADLMKAVMDFIETMMKGGGQAAPTHRGTIVVGTVYQDVHSIGKDLTKTLMENYGYRVIDLGVQVPLEDFIQTAIKEKADAIGMSALLVQTANHMLTVARMMADQGLDIPVLIGGAPVNLRHAAQVAHAGKSASGQLKPDVFYCPSAMTCINVLEQLFSDNRAPFVRENLAQLEAIHNEQKNKKASSAPGPKAEPVDFSTYRPAFCPVQVRAFSPRVSQIQLNRKALQSLNWRAGSRMTRKNQGQTAEQANQLIDHWIQRAEDNNWIAPKGRMAVFQCNSQEDDLIIYDPDNEDQQLLKIPFEPGTDPSGKPLPSPARYFLPASSGKKDLVGLQIVTAGRESANAVETLKQDKDLESAHLLNGLANRVAEDFAGMLHKELQQTAGVKEGTGARFSPGYPGLNLEQNQAIFQLLDAHDLGITLTEAHGFAPLSTTAALVCFHPDACHR